MVFIKGKKTKYMISQLTGMAKGEAPGKQPQDWEMFTILSGRYSQSGLGHICESGLDWISQAEPPGWTLGACH